MVEEWRDVPGHPGYRASTLGRVMGPRGRILTCKDHNGYFWLMRQQGGKKWRVSHHAMVALAFIGPRPQGHDIDHLDHDRANNSPGNLRYCTHAENMARRIVTARAPRPYKPRGPRRPGAKHGPVKPGEQNGRAKLTEQQAREILALPRPTARGQGVKSDNSLSALAARYGVSKSAVGDILRGKRWVHLRQEGEAERTQTTPNTEATP